MPKDSRPLFKTHRIGGQKGPPIQKGQQLFTKNIKLFGKNTGAWRRTEFSVSNF